MTPSVERQLVNGVWETHVVDEAGGGGTGLPTGWTQQGDPAVVNANGGSLQVDTLLVEGSVTTPESTDLHIGPPSGEITIWPNAAPAATEGSPTTIAGGQGNGGGSDGATILLGGGSAAFTEGELSMRSSALGFFSESPVARPEVPAIPTQQDIVDALVALGLVTQA